MMLSFVIHSKPELALYSSPDRLPLLTSSQRKGRLELSAVARRSAKRGFLFLPSYSLQKGTAAKKQETQKYTVENRKRA